MFPENFSLSLVFPAYDEEGNLEPVVSRAAEVMAGLGIEDYEVVIVNDGSRDRTGALADELAGRAPRVRVVHHPVNQGYGAALRSGFKAAAKQLVFYTDADQQFDLGELPRLLALSPYADIITGFRTRKQYNLYRGLISSAYNLIIRALFGLSDLDINCSFKLYPRELFDRIELQSRHYFIDAEIAIQARRLGYRTIQVGVSHLPRSRGSSHAAPPRFSLYTFKEVISAYLQPGKGRHP